MLLLLFKNAMWAAWWPYYTMLLAMEKAATQAAANRPKSTSNTAVNDASMQAEITPALRELMKMSIEQAKRAFEAFVATSEQAWKSLETGSPSGRAGLFALNAKIVETTRLNAEANFALAAKLTEATDLAQAIDLQTRHVKQQMDIFVQQLEEMRDLAAQIIQQANPATRTDAGVKAASGPSSGSSSSAYAPSSSVTPGEAGRTSKGRSKKAKARRSSRDRG